MTVIYPNGADNLEGLGNLALVGRVKISRAVPVTPVKSDNQPPTSNSSNNDSPWRLERLGKAVTVVFLTNLSVSEKACGLPKNRDNFVCSPTKISRGRKQEKATQDPSHCLRERWAASWRLDEKKNFNPWGDGIFVGMSLCSPKTRNRSHCQIAFSLSNRPPVCTYPTSSPNPRLNLQNYLLYVTSTNTKCQSLWCDLGSLSTDTMHCISVCRVLVDFYYYIYESLFGCNFFPSVWPPFGTLASVWAWNSVHVEPKRNRNLPPVST